MHLKVFVAFLFVVLLQTCPLWAQQASPSQIEQMPSLALRRQGKGTLKVCSKPLEVAVHFKGELLQKNRAVLTVDDVEPGLYDVVFEGGGKRLVKKARIVPGETTIIFGSLDSPEAKPAQDVALAPQPVAQAAGTADVAPVAAPAAATLAPISSLSGTGAEGLRDMKDAEIAFEYAELLRNSINPFTASSRYRKALELYRRIWEKFPDSPRVELAHYNSGRIYESIHIKDYAGAIEQYRTVLVINAQTSTDAAERIAKLYGGVFQDQATAQLGVMAQSQDSSSHFVPKLDPGVAPTTVYSSQTEWQPQVVDSVPPVPSGAGSDGVTLQP